MPPKKTAAAAKSQKESAAVKKRRVANNKKAKQDAVKYAIPAILVIFLAIALFFFYQYGIGKQLVSKISKAAAGRR